MKVTPTAIADVLLIEPEVFGDERGFFFESYNTRSFKRYTGLEVDFVQDNHSRSSRYVLRGLHYQIRHPQGKLARVILGRVCDVVVDLRRSSSTFGRWVSEEFRQRTSGSCGSQLVSLTVLLFLATQPILCTRPLTTMTATQSARSCGTIPIWRSIGASIENLW